MVEIDDKLGVEYRENTNDLLLEVEVPQQTGYDVFLTNIGEVQNEGLEFQMRSANIVWK